MDVDKDIKGKKILLVGGAGFIGHNLAFELSSLGANVHIIDSLQVNNFGFFLSDDISTPDRELYYTITNHRIAEIMSKKINVHIQDARDYSALAKTVLKIEPDVVIHLAAVAHANKANKNPFNTFDHSLRTLENSLDAVRDLDKGVHFIFFSSSMVYGNFEDGKATEESPCNPLGIYGALKFSGEKITLAYNQVFDLSYTIVRPSALYGEGCVSRRVGQVFIENALRGKPITIFGNENDCLDFTYIKDLIHGVVKIIQSPNSRNETFNITYGKSRSMREMANIIQNHFPEVTINHKAQDSLVPKRGTLIIDKAKKLIGYDPKHPLEEGMENYINWYREFAENNPGAFETT